jgi:hypothetical protein
VKLTTHRAACLSDPCSAYAGRRTAVRPRPAQTRFTHSAHAIASGGAPRTFFSRGLHFAQSSPFSSAPGTGEWPSVRSSTAAAASGLGRVGPHTETEKVGVTVVVTLHARGSLHVRRLLLAAKRPPSPHALFSHFFYWREQKRTETSQPIQTHGVGGGSVNRLRVSIISSSAGTPSKRIKRCAAPHLSAPSWYSLSDRLRFGIGGQVRRVNVGGVRGREGGPSGGGGGRPAGGRAAILSAAGGAGGSRAA